MCGFVGSFYHEETLVTAEKISQLRHQTEMISHRGPDASGYFMNEHVGFGFKRLSIVDLEGGHQPMTCSEGRLTIVFNGEIYNHLELRERLVREGYTFRTNSDTEVILTLYKKEKERSFQALRGMFAFVIWDESEKQVTAVRDRFGIKPFYYTETAEGLHFASEKKCLLPDGETTAPNDKEALQHYFTYQYVPEPMTLSKAVRRLEPGTFLVVKPNCSPELRPYWKPSLQPTADSFRKKTSAVREALEDSVKLHMRSDVPVGTFLSGGVDSAIITALAKQCHPNIETFSVGFQTKGFDETQLAAETAEKLEVRNHRKIVSPEEFLREMPNLVWHFDDPVADPAAVPLYFVAKEARRKVKVVLSGEGADELFGGYNIYREPIALRWFSFLPRTVIEKLGELARKLPETIKGRNYLIRGCTPLEQRYIGNAKIFTEEEKQAWLKTYDAGVHFTQLTRRLFEEMKDEHALTKMQYIDLHTWLRGDILQKADKMSMAHALELRVPFLDQKVFEAASGLAPSDKTRSGTTKYALREAMKGIVPEAALYRKKLGFPVPIRQWLRNEWQDWARQVIRESAIEAYVQKSEALKMLEKHWRGDGDHSRKLWTILTFAVWHQVFVESNAEERSSEQEMFLYGS
ncbi:MAG TPA: asparagine synthase (glutamine-hydrolyzing) [Bacillales bacterium]|nr:asparagine synthase (glutamine-hydrolyzing) [Bacillales bacterium]